MRELLVDVRRMIVSKKEKSIHGDGGAWRRGRQLGKGGFGTVHLAAFPNPPAKSGRFKGFPSKAAVKSANTACSKELQKEKNLYEWLGESPHILRYLGEDTTVHSKGATRLNVFLEYAAGGTLHDLVKKSKGLGLLETQARRFTRSILLGVKHIHAAGFVHCDLKPLNVLLVRDGRGDLVAKIADLGSAKRAEERMLVDGTPMFLAPECLKYEIQGKAADIWGIGCIVFSMLTGRSEWDGSLDQEIARLIHPTQRYSEQALDFLRQCLSSDPRTRPTARMLLSHPFLSGCDQSLHNSPNSTITRTALPEEKKKKKKIFISCL